MKNHDEYFKNVCGIGTLYLDYVFYRFETEPIIFTCIDEKDDLYLCLCSEIRYGQTWIISKCTLERLKELIEQKRDLATTLSVPESVVVISMDLDGKENSCIVRTSELDQFDLPQQGVYLRCDRAEAELYLESKLPEHFVYDMQLTLHVPFPKDTYKSDIMRKEDTKVDCVDYYDKSGNQQRAERLHRYFVLINRWIKTEYHMELTKASAVAVVSIETSIDCDQYLQAA